tara:strand:- start:2764 stop:3366 length:603 start_codon:yes stop_codon:yes gene_type:complete
MNKILNQFIPIIILFLLLSYSNEFINFSNTVLGKLFAILVIIYYTILDKRIGLLVCSLVIFYYQSDVVENMLNIDEIMGKKESKDSKEVEIEGMENMQCPKRNTQKENMSDLDEIYEKELLVDKSLDGVNKFRDEHCEGKNLKYKNMDVKDDVVEHVFPEVKYNSDKCNPCADTCDISILENKLKNEKEMVPKFSKDEKM